MSGVNFNGINYSCLERFIRGRTSLPRTKNEDGHLSSYSELKCLSRFSAPLASCIFWEGRGSLLSVSRLEDFNPVLQVGGRSRSPDSLRDQGRFESDALCGVGVALGPPDRDIGSLKYPFVHGRRAFLGVFHDRVYTARGHTLQTTTRGRRQTDKETEQTLEFRCALHEHLVRPSSGKQSPATLVVGLLSDILRR